MPYLLTVPYGASIGAMNLFADQVGAQGPTRSGAVADGSKWFGQGAVQQKLLCKQKSFLKPETLASCSVAEMLALQISDSPHPLLLLRACAIMIQIRWDSEDRCDQKRMTEIFQVSSPPRRVDVVLATIDRSTYS